MDILPCILFSYTNESWFGDFALLLSGVRKLYDCFTLEDLIPIQNDFITVVKNWEDNFSLPVTINVHFLLHLCHFAKIWGPLNCVSSFCFEREICALNRKLHGTRNFLTQVSWYMAMSRLYHELEDEM